jgi:transcriptional regulator of acetoin/glycerol metabolism
MLGWVLLLHQAVHNAVQDFSKEVRTQYFVKETQGQLKEQARRKRKSRKRKREAEQKCEEKPLISTEQRQPEHNDRKSEEPQSKEKEVKIEDPRAEEKESDSDDWEEFLSQSIIGSLDIELHF